MYEELQNQNPIDVYRPELMVDDIVDYFVEPHFLPDLKSGKPIMLVGARGTGKTTLLKYLAYESQKKLLGDDFLHGKEFLGVFWRAEINYVNGFQGSGISEEEWIRIFSHHINVILCSKLCDIIVDIQKNYKCIVNEKLICKQVGEEFSFSDCSTFYELSSLFRKARIQVEKYVNNINRVERPILSTLKRGLDTFCSLLNKEQDLNKVWFFFLIDEYENMLEYQQKIINTLIKHSEFPYTFKICRRSKGDKTRQTLLADETLSDPADYVIIDLTQQMGNKKIFEQFARMVCNKRLEKIPQLKEKGISDITYFLNTLTYKEEALKLEGRSGILYEDKLKDAIFSNNDLNTTEKETIFQEIMNEDNPIIRRLCLAVLDRGKISVTQLIDEYRKYKRGERSNFTHGKEWIHNTEEGILFLLCYEYRIPKLYCGFDTFVHLSSGIIRHMLELCYITFNYAFQDGLQFGNPKPIPYEIQSKAVKFVANKRLSEIDTYQPYGQVLKVLAFSLGRLFELFHKDPKQSEPERNQFGVALEKLNPETQKIFNSAIMWSVLQEVKGSKHKSKAKIKLEDYALHPIYSPYFQISPHLGRKIDISPDQLEKIIFDGDQGRNEVFKQLLKISSVTESSKFYQGTLFDDDLDGGV